MKLLDLFEATTLAFTNPKTRFQHQEKKDDLPLKTFKSRTRIRNAAQTNLVVKDSWAYHIISDIPPITVKEWSKLLDVTFGKESDDVHYSTPGIPPNNAIWNISTFPRLDGRKDDSQKTNELWNDKRWDKFEEEREPWTHPDDNVKPTDVKTMTWKQYAAVAYKRFPFNPKDDFSE